MTTSAPAAPTPPLAVLVVDPRNLDFARRLIDLFVETMNERRHR